MDDAKVERVRSAALVKLARVFDLKGPPTAEGNLGRVQALLLTAATMQAATENAGNDPRMFEAMAEAALDAFEEVVRRYRTGRN